MNLTPLIITMRMKFTHRYHILRGSKVFWLIPPTEKNLQLYEKWVLSGKQSDVFFGDTVEKCARVYLTAGNTFFIPTGYIHAVYTPTDVIIASTFNFYIHFIRPCFLHKQQSERKIFFSSSPFSFVCLIVLRLFGFLTIQSLVFGGNFLHSFGISKQLKIAKVEDSTKVPQKFRYPFFTEMLWYALAKYVRTLLGRSHLEDEPDCEKELEGKPHIHLTHYELFGLKEIVMYLYDLPPHRKNVPELICDPVRLIKDVRSLVERHCRDIPELAVTGRPVLFADPDPVPDVTNSNGTNNGSTETSSSQQAEQKVNVKVESDSNETSPKDKPTNNKAKGSGSKKKANDSIENGTGDERNGNSANAPRRRRRRCKICKPCNSTECGQCAFCLDMVRYRYTQR